jgi:hypothetical protein|tara:strand:- start:147 stop:518 length:372 start_codon:yes stop_codon:yes gene_type:complete
MSAATYNLFIDQGSDFAIDLVIKESGTAKNLSNYSGRGQLRSSHTSTTIAGYLKVTVTNASAGSLKVELPNSNWTDSGGTARDGSKNIAAGQYVYDVEIFTNSDAVVKRIIQGTATINPEVTR